VASGAIKSNTLGIRNIDISMTIEGNSTYNANLINKINSDLPSGCRCLGICGFTTGSDSLVPIQVSYTAGGDFSFLVRNISGAQRTGTAHVQYLCQYS